MHICTSSSLPDNFSRRSGLDWSISPVRKHLVPLNLLLRVFVVLFRALIHRVHLAFSEGPDLTGRLVSWKPPLVLTGFPGRPTELSKNKKTNRGLK